MNFRAVTIVSLCILLSASCDEQNTGSKIQVDNVRVETANASHDNDVCQCGEFIQRAKFESDKAAESLRNEMKGLVGEVELLKSKLAVSETSRGGLLSQLEEEKKMCSERTLIVETRAERLERQVSGITEQLDECNVGKTNAIEERNIELEKRVKELEAKIKDTKSALDDAVQAKESFKEQGKRYLESHEKLQNEHIETKARMTMEISELTTQKIMAEDEKKILEMNVKDMRDTVTSIQSEKQGNTELEKRVKELEGKIKETESALDDAVQAKESYKEQVKSNLKSHEKMQTEHVKTKARMAMEISELKTQKIMAEDENKDLAMNMEQIRDQLTSIQSLKHNAEKQKASLEDKYNHMVKRKERELSDLTAQMEEITEKERKGRDMLSQAHLARGESQRELNLLRDHIRARDDEAKLHYCNATMIMDDVQMYASSTRELLSPYEAKILVLVEEAMALYRGHVKPNVENLKKASMTWYDANLKNVVDTHIIPVYNQHVAPVVASTSTEARKVAVSLRLFFVSKIEKLSRDALTKMDRAEKTRDGEQALMIDVLTYTAANAEDVVHYMTVTMFVGLVVLFARFLLRLAVSIVLAVILFPFRMLAKPFVSKKEKKRKAPVEKKKNVAPKKNTASKNKKKPEKKAAVGKQHPNGNRVKIH